MKGPDGELKLRASFFPSREDTPGCFEILAHTDGKVPNVVIRVKDMTAYSLGQLFYFYEFACGVSGYMLGVNPFNQPGVESYKKNMFALLNKPGFEERRAELLKRLGE